MFTNTISVLFVERAKIGLYDVVVGAKATVKLVDSLAVEAGKYAHAVSEVISRHRRKSLRILLASDLSLITKLAVDKKSLSDDMQDVLYKLVQERIPESFTQDQWDFVLADNDSSSSSSHTVTAFVPVMNVYEQLAKALSLADIAEAVPVVPQDSLSAKPNEAIALLAAQQDFADKNKSVLHVLITRETLQDDHSSKSSTEQESPSEDGQDSKEQSGDLPQRADLGNDHPTPSQRKNAKLVTALIIAGGLVLIGSAVITVLLYM